VEGKGHIPAAVNRVSVGRVQFRWSFSEEVWRVQAGKVLGGAAGECPSRRQAIHGVQSAHFPRGHCRGKWRDDLMGHVIGRGHFESLSLAGCCRPQGVNSAYLI
jgi:hypothetical protein